MEWSWSGERDEIPAEAGRILHGIVRRAPLREVSALVTHRSRLVFRGADGGRCAELDDDVVTVIANGQDRARCLGPACSHIIVYPICTIAVVSSSPRVMPATSGG